MKGEGIGETEAGRKLVAAAEGADDRRFAGIAGQALISRISRHAPGRAELVDDAAHGADPMEAAARREDGKAGPHRDGRRHAEISALIAAVGRVDARADREDGAVVIP